MKKLLLVAVLSFGGVVGTVGRADAWSWGHTGPYPASAVFPCSPTPGWQTNTYSYAWYYPWFAYYNYSHGPYANWMAGGGVASYAWCVGESGHGHTPAAVSAPHHPHHPLPKVKKPEAGTVTISLPADAKLLFNGTAATGTGATRTFATTALQPGQDYAYDLTAEIVRDGRVQTVTERVVVRAGETAKVTLNVGVTTASAK